MMILTLFELIFEIGVFLFRMSRALVPSFILFFIMLLISARTDFSTFDIIFHQVWLLCSMLFGLLNEFGWIRTARSYFDRAKSRKQMRKKYKNSEAGQ
jgi:hypothetical protein